MSGSRKNQLYLVGEQGHILAFSAYPEVDVQSIYATVKISVTDEPITSTLDGQSYRHAAIVTPPAFSEFRHRKVAVVAFVIYPNHPLYRAIHALPPPKVLPLNRRYFQHFDDQLLALSEETLPIAEAREVFESICALVSALLPAPPPIDSRVATVLDQLHADHMLTADQLAADIGLSPRQVSRLFRREFGIGIPDYKLGLMLSKAAAHYRPDIDVESFARALGFSSAQQYAHVFSRLHGAPLSYVDQLCDIHA